MHDICGEMYFDKGGSNCPSCKAPLECDFSGSDLDLAQGSGLARKGGDFSSDEDSSDSSESCVMLVNKTVPHGSNTLKTGDHDHSFIPSSYPTTKNARRSTWTTSDEESVSTEDEVQWKSPTKYAIKGANTIGRGCKECLSNEDSCSSNSFMALELDGEGDTTRMVVGDHDDRGPLDSPQSSSILSPMNTSRFQNMSLASPSPCKVIPLSFMITKSTRDPSGFASPPSEKKSKNQSIIIIDSDDDSSSDESFLDMLTAKPTFKRRPERKDIIDICSP
jgi:hypothetical protein